MKQLALVLPLLALPALALAEDIWRWNDSQGRVHYSNLSGAVPDGATRVETRITIDADRLPGAPGDSGLALVEGEVVDKQPAPCTKRRVGSSRWLPDAPRIYDQARLKSGCFTAGVLYSGGFAHADDIADSLNCYPYRLGPEAWLNAAKAELAMRQSGINPRDMAEMYDEYMKGDR